MSVNISALIQLLCELEDGDEICVGGYTIKREGNKIWQHIFDHHDEDEIDEEIVEGEEGEYET
jgi:acyl CoA:acetate/3-ketoacid CoA transferase alpha subunit